MDNLNFTEEDLKDWRAYEHVRLGGQYNMFDPVAQLATGLVRNRFIFVMKNFAALKRAASKM